MNSNSLFRSALLTACAFLTLATAALPTRAQTTVAPPRLMISVNGAAEPQVVQGEPLIVTVVLSNPLVFSPSATALQINAQNGSWANTVKVGVIDSTGATAPWSIQLAKPASGSLIVDGEQVGVLHYLVTAASSKSIAPGSYNVIASIDTTASAGTTGWKGTTSSNAAFVQVTSSSSATAAQLENQMLSQSLADHLLGNDAQAVADLNPLLAQNPTSVPGLKLRAALLTNLGDLRNALDATQKAIAAIYAQTPAPQEPPSALWHSATQLREAIYHNTTQQAAVTSIIATSPSATFNPGTQTITLTATVSSAGASVAGGTVTFTVVGVGLAVTSGQVVQGKASATFTIPAGTHPGTYTLDASYSGNASFLSSADPKENLTIVKAKPVIVWANPADISQGTPLSTTQLNATANIQGVFTYTPAAGTVLPLGSAQQLSATFTPADTTDYSTTSASVVINVKSAALIPLTITATSATRAYGQPNPAFTVTYKGFASGDTSAVLSGSLTCTTTATAKSATGSYAITCSGLTSTKYSIQYVSGSLSVTAASLTVTAKNATRPFAQANPAFTASFSAFANGDTSASLSGTLVCTSTATQTSTVAGSPYPITCSGSNVFELLNQFRGGHAHDHEGDSGDHLGEPRGHQAGHRTQLNTTQRQRHSRRHLHLRSCRWHRARSRRSTKALHHLHTQRQGGLQLRHRNGHHQRHRKSSRTPATLTATASQTART